MGSVLIPTLIQVALGASLAIAFRRRPEWRQVRAVRLGTLVAILCSLVVYSAALLGAGGTLGSALSCLLLVLIAYLPTVCHLITHEAAVILPEEVDREAEVVWTWRVRRRLLFGNEGRRRRLWRQKRDRLEGLPTDPVLRLELLELSMGLGEYGEALFHAHALDEFLPRGETHAFVLLRAAQILAEKQQRLAAAQPVLHRLIRLYPVSVHRDEADRLIRLFEQAPGI